jgi:hypothetical protein
MNDTKLTPLSLTDEEFTFLKRTARRIGDIANRQGNYPQREQVLLCISLALRSVTESDSQHAAETLHSCKTDLPLKLLSVDENRQRNIGKLTVQA